MSRQRTSNCPRFLFSYIAHAAPLQPIIIKSPILTQVPFNCQLTSFSQVLHEWTPRNTPGIFPRHQRPLFLHPLGYLLSSPYPSLCNICYHSNILSSWISSFPSFPTELWLCSLLFVFSLVLTISFLGGLLFFSPLSNASFESSVQFSWSVMSDSLPPHGLQHARPPCPSPTPGACSNSCPSSQWCHPTISSCVIPFSSCLQSFPESGSFPMSQFFSSGGQSIGVSASASVLPMNIQDWSPLGWTGLISLQSKGL